MTDRFSGLEQLIEYPFLGIPWNQDFLTREDFEEDWQAQLEEEGGR